MKNVVVVGDHGMLGRALCGKLLLARRAQHVRGFDVSEVDITKRDSVWAQEELRRADVIFNCAAYTAVDKAEDDEELATRVNCDGVRHLAELVRETGALLVHLSTDYVFDGQDVLPYSPNAVRNPLSAYGRSKAKGEHELELSGARYLLVRTAWLYGPHGRNFVDTIARLATECDVLEVVYDQVGSPTYVFDLADALVELVVRGAEGTYHCVNSGSTSWYDLAKDVVRLVGAKMSVRPITSQEAVDKKITRATRPLRAVLSCVETERFLGRAMRPWRKALTDYLET
jgi:dTDP-4-dehydrorhamnose reductase